MYHQALVDDFLEYCYRCHCGYHKDHLFLSFLFCLLFVMQLHELSQCVRIHNTHLHIPDHTNILFMIVM